MAGSSAELMQTAPVFRDLSDDDRHVLVRIGEARLYRKGDSIFREGDRAERLYTVLRGRVKIYKSTPTEKDIILAILGPGAPVGAVAVYHGVPFPASATAFEDAVPMSIPAAAYFDILEKEPGLVRLPSSSIPTAPVPGTSLARLSARRPRLSSRLGTKQTSVLTAAGSSR